MGMGIRMLQAKASELENIPDSVRGIKLFISSFAIGVTNPTAILTFLFAFSWFSIDGQSGLAEGIGLVAGVFLGTFCWWSVISGTVIMLEKKAKNNRLPIMNTVFGIILVLFGAVVLSRNILN